MSEWIEWKGGECPVDGETIVQVGFRDGIEMQGERADFWDWSHARRRSFADIVAYRVVKEKEA
ncbi:MULTISPECIES: hypothetical protein [unclassified Herbaspirillum]|uniref:hypothetical protein n=1 Tax=unclassified Herbaspirillum TaxID=2624150 RepID=UPI000C0AD81E|nr:MULTISPECIES: hypothetical protein [unclassified Herbaspirillum]MAF05937.1 hypothetical protein [Herbaspirillum sp.]MBO17897.1 hypothetical protein [Herbaspirillum sp.]|tara:strand:+ start:53 stop:241 length:189 start_codon:yes stop_codon:yes gene_type:complete